MQAGTVLIVDDDADDCIFFCDAVREIAPQMHCLSCTDGQAAISLLQQESGPLPDYVFLDMNMPRMNGRQCLMALKELPRLQHTVFVMYSTSKFMPEVQAALSLGAAHFLSKPARYAELKRRLQQCFEGEWAEGSVQ